VRAAGDGTIVEAGRRKGNGRYLKIRHHNSAYESYYLHLSRYGKGIKKGSKVEQGQVIGYVGATGYATGPHLDYRVAKNGSFVNPRKLKLPSAEPIPAGEREAFATLVGLYREALLAVTPAMPPQQVALAHTLPPPLWQPPRQAAVLAPRATRSQP
jgi:murein DD-endopeptidase MepM/ murein hydrolase activator NlpD